MSCRHRWWIQQRHIACRLLGGTEVETLMACTRVVEITELISYPLELPTVPRHWQTFLSEVSWHRRCALSRDSAEATGSLAWPSLLVHVRTLNVGLITHCIVHALDVGSPDRKVLHWVDVSNQEAHSTILICL